MKKNTILIILIVLLVISNIFFIIYSFNEKEDEIIVEPFVMKIENEDLDEFKRKAMNDGDFDAYNKISDYYTLNYLHDELFFYSFLMAYNHNDPNAFFDLYILLSVPLKKNGIKMFSMDETTYNFALYFLLKSYELGNINAKSQIDRVLGEGKEIPNSSYYLYKIAGDSVSDQNKN